MAKKENKMTEKLFHNTRLDLQDCLNALEEREIASEEEKQYEEIINEYELED